MRFSFKKNEDSFFTLLEEYDNKDPETQKDDSNRKVSRTALTPEEVTVGFGENNSSDVQKTGALDMLKQRIITAAEQSEEEGGNTDNKEIESTKDDHAESAAENRDSIEDLKLKLSSIMNTKTESIPKKEEKSDAEKVFTPAPSLLDKCQPFIKDENGNAADINAKPLYKLQSVSEILKSDSEKTLERLSEKYDISFDDLGHTSKAPKMPTESTAKTEPETKAKSYFKAEPIQEDREDEFEERISVKNVQSNVKSIISDIDIPITDTKPDEPNVSENTATITFTPINDGKNSESHLRVSSQTRPIDLSGELVKLPSIESEQNDEIKLEKNEFEDYAPQEEFKDPKNAGRFIKKFSIKKRNAFITAFFSIALTIISAVTKLPFMNQLILSHTKTVMLICTVVTGIIVILNGNMFLSFKNILSRRSAPDICASLSALTTLAYAVSGIISGDIITDILLLLSIILSFRSLAVFFKASYTLSNFRQISGSDNKKAVKLINDTAVTFAMAKNAIEGDVLIAAPQKCMHIDDYMKYSSFNTFLGGKLPILTVLSVIISAILGFACASYFDGAVYGLYAAAAVQCFTALPVVFFIDTFSLYRTAKKVNKKGGMIAGKIAAEYIEMANAVVVDAADLFPSGTITLHQMKVLSENNLDDTIIRAASLTESLNSTLAPIFKKIAGTGNISVLPDSDTVKYEDRMGISGWVDNRLLFIGNRTLMQTHGIEVPPIEVDHKILRQGFFPVYVATMDKACALLVVQYNVDGNIAGELRKLTSSGVTLLINSCDPNLIESMICDYFGLYGDLVKVMSAAGSHMYKNAVSPLKSISAPASFKANPIALITIINCAARIKKSNILLTIMYIISLVSGTVLFAYTSLGGSGTLISETTLLLYGLLSTVISYIIYLIARP